MTAGALFDLNMDADEKPGVQRYSRFPSTLIACPVRLHAAASRETGRGPVLRKNFILLAFLIGAEDPQPRSVLWECWRPRKRVLVVQSARYGCRSHERTRRPWTSGFELGACADPAGGPGTPGPSALCGRAPL